MKNQALLSWKDKSKKLKCRLLQFLFGALRVNTKLNFPRKKSLKKLGCVNFMHQFHCKFPCIPEVIN